MSVKRMLRSPLVHYLRLPMPLRIGMAIAAGGGSLYMLTYFFRGRALWVIMIGMSVVALLLVAYRGYLKKRKKKKAAPMEQGIVEQTAATPQGITDAGRRARLDDLRKNFEEGVQKFRAAGKDLYSLPWYAVVGEPGSGKTEAIRHCNVGFPPGLQDPFQGAGGTINMNWWFTNKAVILDTAGRLMFEEVPAGTTGEWEEFLRLLRGNRPNCPINGLFLVIPADTLITDNADAIKTKGEKIAQQLDKIQRTLQVRFPVFVIITKADLVNGFREFFENVGDPALAGQLLGWSSGEPLDDAFNPELVDQHLESVSNQLRRRRLGLLIDPVHSENPNGQRIDQVDALYAFPQSIKRITSRLKLYLQIVFAGSEWSGRPLFLRGIYFTSAMREGSALDEELADALGVPVESLPDGRVWERDRSYFLRDVFLEKAFKEWGLVTRASDARAQHRRRKAVVLGAAFAAVFLLGFLTWFGAKALDRSIGIHRDYWVAAAEKDNWQANKVTQGPAYWKPIVKQEFIGSPNWEYRGDSALKVGAEKLSVAAYHRKLLQLSDKPIEVPWVFWLARVGTMGLGQRRLKAHRVLFEAGVLRPLVDASRKKMLEDTDAWPKEADAALAELIRLETPSKTPPELDPLYRVVLYRPGDGGAAPAAKKGDEEAAPAHLKGYLADRETLKAIVKWMYGDGGGTWPPEAIGIGADAAHEAIHGGIERFIKHWSAQGQRASVALGQITDLKDLLLLKYKDTEGKLLHVDDEFSPRLARLTETEAKVVGEATQAWAQRLAELEKARTELEAKLAFFPDGPLADTFAARSGGIVKGIEEAFARFRDDAGIDAVLEEGKPGLLDRIKGAAGKAVDDAARKKAPKGAPKPGTAAAPGTAIDPAQAVEAVLGVSEQGRKIVGEVDAKLVKALDAIRRIAKPEAIAAEVATCDREFLMPIDVDPRLWRRLVELELVKTEGDKRSLRLYALRSIMYRFADGELRRRDPLPEKGSFRDAVEGVRQNIERAVNQVSELKAVEPKAVRFDDAAGVSTFTCQRLALRQRISLMLDSLLAKAPTKEDQIAAHLEARAKKLPAVLQPTVPFTTMKGGHFEPRFHPAATLAMLRDVRDAGSVLDDPKVEVLERDRLRELWRVWQAGCTQYVDGEYHRYWTQRVPTDLESHGQDWKSFRRTWIQTQPFDVLLKLGEVGKAMGDALSSDLEEVLPPESQAKFKRSRETIGLALRKLQNTVYQGQCKQVQGNWCRLSEDAFEARNTLIPLERDKIFGEYLPFFYTSAEAFADKYWADVTLEALRLIIAGAGQDGLAAFDTLVNTYSRFPLDKPRANEKQLTIEEVNAARLLVTGLVATGVQRGTRTPGDEPDPGRREIERLLEQLRTLRIEEGKWTWIQKLKAVLDGLPAGEKHLKCEAWLIANDPPTPAVSDRWAHIRSKQGAQQTGKGPASPGLDYKLCDAYFPGDPFELLLHQNPVDEVKGLPPSRTLIVEGPWSMVRLLHPGQAVDTLYKRWQFVHKWEAMDSDARRETADPKVRDVLITFEDDQRVRRKLRLQLRFERPLPDPDDWPTKPGP